MLRMQKLAFFILLFVLMFASAGAQEKESSENKALAEITVDDAKTHLEYLASKELKGREAGSAEGKKAADYIVKLLKSMKITPAGDNNTYFQAVPGLGKPKFDAKNNSFKIWTAGKDFDEPTTVECEMGKEYSPMGYVNKAKVKAREAER